MLNVYVEEELFKGFWVLEWGKNLLRNGESHKQFTWSDLTKDEDEKVPPAPFVMASILAG